MKKNSSTPAFKTGFWFGILLFIALNFYSLIVNYGGCLDCYGEFGIPFTLGDRNIKYLEFIWSGLIADVIFALMASWMIGLISKTVWTKAAARRLR